MKPGDSFAQYEIQGPIGAGGMGEVFLAHDTKLRRDVAVVVNWFDELEPLVPMH